MLGLPFKTASRGGQVVQGACNLCETADKSSIVRRHAKEPAYVSSSRGNGVPLDGFDFYGVCANTGGSDDMAKEVYLRLDQLALGNLDPQTFFGQSSKCAFKVDKMVLIGFREYNDIVHVDDDEIKVMKDFVHHSLER